MCEARGECNLFFGIIHYVFGGMYSEFQNEMYFAIRRQVTGSRAPLGLVIAIAERDVSVRYAVLLPARPMAIRAKQRPSKVAKVPEHRRASTHEGASDDVRRVVRVVVDARARNPRGEEGGQQAQRYEHAVEFEEQARLAEADSPGRGAESQGADEPEAGEEERRRGSGGMSAWKGAISM